MLKFIGNSKYILKKSVLLVLLDWIVDQWFRSSIQMEEIAFYLKMMVPDGDLPTPS